MRLADRLLLDSLLSVTGCELVIKEVQTRQCQILETFTYCLEENKIITADTTAITECSGIHEHIIKPFFRDMAYRQGKKPEAIKVSGYCNTHCYLSLSDNLPDDTIRQTFGVTIDILSPGKYNTAFGECLDNLRDKDFTTIDVISEAFVQCFALWDDGKLFFVWCSLLDDGERIIRLIREQGFLVLT